MIVTIFNRRRQQRGVALITALLIVSLASVMAVTLVADQQIDIRRTANVVDGDRAMVIAMAVESWVKHILARDDATKDSLNEDWAAVLPPITVEGGQVAGRIEDMQGRFNLNNLVTVTGQPSLPDIEIFKRLLVGFGLDPDLVEPLIDWIDTDIDPRFEGGGGAEDNEYSNYPQPYRTANQKMASPSELMLVKGFTREIYEQLIPHVGVLPERTQININTATVPVLMALAPDITQAAAEAVVELRKERGLSNTGEMTNLPGMQGKVFPQNGLDIKSNYFLMDASARYGDRGRIRLYSLLVRKSNKVEVVMRAQGVY
ncbi:MAG: proteinral secretion pathway protein K [Halothiobacillaceae bacterium]|nr:MAG: proteinral secretion pathway protein K [Halothiobacillaceae bacterium]